MRNFNPKGANCSVVRGVGGDVWAGSPQECEIRFGNGWRLYTHPLKPLHMDNSEGNLIILGRDFMQLYDQTLFDWEKGRVKIGGDWVFLANEGEIKCKFDGGNLSSKDLNSLQSLISEYADVFAINPKAPKLSK